MQRALDRIHPRTIEAHLRFLSHPLLEGRAPGTRGGELAVEYVRANFQRIGLEPVAGSYLQEVPMIGLDPHPALAFVTLAGQRISSEYRADYVLGSGIPQARVEVDAELVYVGFGISAPEWEWDDYAGVDVAGKVLLIRVNDPGTEGTPDFFGGRALTYYGRWTYKFEEAARRGAAGAILIHTDESAGYGWNVVRTSNTGEQFTLAGNDAPALRVEGWLRSAVAEELLRAAGLDPQALERASEQRDFLPVAPGIRVHASVLSEVREVRTANVVGLLPGSAPERAEPVVLTSHHDHLGIGSDEQGRTVVYHGAYDNASGVALLLTVAEAAAALDAPPARPLLFLALTAEESGLLGAEWYTRHPLFPLATTAAALNVDGANLEGSTDDLSPLGVERSELGGLVAAAAREEGMRIAPEPHPEQGMFFRQDHFPFARAGVPSLALDHGLAFRDRPAGWGERWYEEFVGTHYHQPSDAFREGIDYGGAVQQGRVLLRTALAVAERERLPEWSVGAGFAGPPAG